MVPRSRPSSIHFFSLFLCLSFFSGSVFSCWVLFLLVAAVCFFSFFFFFFLFFCFVFYFFLFFVFFFFFFAAFSSPDGLGLLFYQIYPYAMETRLHCSAEYGTDIERFLSSDTNVTWVVFNETFRA